VLFHFPVKHFVVAICAALFSFAATTGLAQPRRALPGHVPDVVGHLQPLSDVAAKTPVRLAVGLPLRNKAALASFIEDLYNPASPRFHRYLTTAQFTERFGPTEEDYQKVQDYLRARGLKVSGAHANRMVVDVVGAAADVEKAFNVHLHVYRHPTEQRNFFAPDSDPWVEANVPVLDVMGLDNYIVPHPLDLQRKKAGVQNGASVTNYAEEGSGPHGLYIGNDFRAAYVPGVTNTGSGQYIALVEFGPYWTNDIHVYETTAGLSSNIVVSNIFLDDVTEPPSAGTDAGEQALDIEMCISMAPGATVLYYGGEVVDDIYSRIASDNLAGQISCSFGFGIDETTEQLYQEFVAQGQNFFEASGDGGAEVGQINPPAAEPYITLVGGTALSTVSPGGAWQQELTWVGSGGGVSTFYAMPNYQQGINMTPLFGSSTMRNFPDVSMMADTVIFIAANNGTGGVGGTSCSSPQWAGFYALANQQAATLGNPRIGFFNPTLYALGKSASYTTLFHDVTSGNTTNYSSGPHKFFAAAGYDLATGWGSPNGINLINALAGVGTTNFMLYATPVGLNLTVGGSDEVLLNAQAMTGFNGDVSLSVSNLPSGVTASFNPPTISGASTSILTLTASSSASAGTTTVTLVGASGGITQTNGLTLTIVAATPGTAEVNLFSSFNLAAIYNDGTSFSGGADGDGNAFSANLLGSALNWNGCLFSMGSPGANDAIKCSGQTITLPAASYSSVQILAAAVDGAQAAQQFIVTYTDGTTSTFVQSMSDWAFPSDFTGETVVVPTAYRDSGDTKDTLTQANLYGYSFGLNNSKILKSIKLPDNNDVLVFAMTLANDFTLYGSPVSYVMTAGGKSTSYLVSGPVNGLSGSVSLSVTGLPPGVTAAFSPAASTTNSILTLTASATAQPVNTSLMLSGTLDGVTHNVSMDLSVITPSPGATAVNLAPYFGVGGIVSDGTTFSATGGLDGAGNAYSAALLGTAPNWGGHVFSLGAAGANDAVPCTGQTITVSPGQYTGLMMLGAAVNASQSNQTFVLNYADGSSVEVTQGISLWTAPQNYAGESIAVSTAYADTSGGTNGGTPVNLYGYVLGLNDSKTITSVVLPNNPDVLILAMAPANAPTPVLLASAFNRVGIYTDGTSFSASAGFNAAGSAYSASQFGASQVFDSVQFNFGAANAADVVKCAGQSIALPTNRYTSLLMLAAANGSQASQTFTVTYTDGTTTPIVQSISDWGTAATTYSNQMIAATMPYRLSHTGSAAATTTFLYGYRFPLNNTKMARSLTLPNNGNVNVLAVTLANTPVPVPLWSSYNRAGIFDNGTEYTTGGLDNDGNSFSGTLLGAGETWRNVPFIYGPVNAADVLSGSAQTIALPPGNFSSLAMLATAVNGTQSSQSFVVTYTNGTTTTGTISLSDWTATGNQTGETTVVPMAYRLNDNGSQVGPVVNLYGYSINLNSSLVVQSLKLPNNGNVEVVAIVLSNFTAALPEAPIITADPPPLTIVSNGTAASFTVSAIGTATLTYQWEKNDAALTNGGNVEGATTSELTLTTTSTNDDGSYTVIVANPYGSVTSIVAVLTIGVAPSITNLPTPLIATNGSPALLTVGASGTPPLFYQWQMDATNLSDGGNIAGSSTAALSLLAAGANDAGSYDVIVTNAFGSVTSSVVTLNVVFLLQSVSVAANGSAVNFSWLSTPGVAYQVQATTNLATGTWTNLGPAIIATNSVTIDLDTIGPDSQRFYRILQQ
jgi:hypothetical protein